MKTTFCSFLGTLTLLLSTSNFSNTLAASPEVAKDLKRIGVQHGVVALVDVPRSEFNHVLDLTRASKLTIYVQTATAENAEKLRKAADAAGFLGTRLFVDSGSSDFIQLADNIADALITSNGSAPDAELLRVLRPQGTAFTGDRKLVKPVPAGSEDWSHPYHGPDNNPQSNDQLVKGDFRTQFLGYPKFSPMPQQTVAGGGRLYKAFGNIAHKANQNEVLNTLMGVSAYNGTILWKRRVPKGFMIHRNTMIATDDALYMGDHESCKVFDGATGQLRYQINIPKEITDGPVWKWMAIRDGILYALVGNPEIQVDAQPSDRTGLGHWPWGMWKGHDYSDPRTAFGFGRTMVAVELATKKLLWHHRDKEFLDARAVCMNGNQIFCYSPEKFLLCLNVKDGKTAWRSTDKEVLEAIDSNGKAQHYVTGYSTSCYIKCNDDYVLFAGPQRKRVVSVKAATGKLAWTHEPGNLQLVLRKDGIYAAGPQKSNGVKLDYSTGSIREEFVGRRACTRATGGIDSIFFRASGGTVRLRTDTGKAEHIAPMRPPCQDGVIISNGHLYWGPWMCGCQLSLYGNIALSPAGKARSGNVHAGALQMERNGTRAIALKTTAADWNTYRGDNALSGKSRTAIPSKVAMSWQVTASANALPTAPVVAGGLVFLADRNGAVRAFDDKGKSVWQAYTGGPVYYPPVIAHNRAYVGSADGCVYAFEAKTGRLLWKFRVGPEQHRIPVFQQLIARWPVSGGVVVQDGTVFAAAGVSHYDGTYVVALDAITGKVKASNSTSGTLSKEVNGGISLQGELFIEEGELRFLGGGVYEVARYDLKTLRCLNEPKAQVTSQYHTAFYPYYPNYGKYLSIDHTCADGSTLTLDASYEGARFSNLTLEKPLPEGQSKVQKEMSRWYSFRNRKRLENIWEDKSNRRITSFAVDGTTLLAAGHAEATPKEGFLASVRIKDGKDNWQLALPSVPVKGGTAMDHRGRIYATLENGQLVCFQ